jgi:methionyl-tRNA synthetase
MKKTFYITTPIYYPSGKFHIGSAYTTCLCDTLARYKQLQGYETRFLTGTDEHGLKIQQAAEAAGKKPQEHVDYIAGLAKDLWKLLKIENDDFIRTTEPRHERVVERIFERLLKQDDIYLGAYSGYYCVHDEAYFTPTQLKEGNICPDCGRETKIVKEETYFLRLSKYQDRLLQFIEDHPRFITPETRKNEVVAFVKAGLNDLSVSRTAFDWGIKVPSNPKHVIYVWIDALSNYISALGYESKDDSLYKKFWVEGDEVVHVVGKDILRFHAIYWPILLMALDVPIRFQLFAHGWYMMKDGKMSKSKGNVIYPEQLVGKYGLDPFRYYIVKELPFGGDGTFTPEDFVNRVNTEIVNDLGNLVSRTIAMAKKYFGGAVRQTVHSHPYLAFENELEATAQATYQTYVRDMDEFKIATALEAVSALVNRTNKLIDETSPWALAKDESLLPVLESVLWHLLEAIRLAAILYRPVLIEFSPRIFEALGIDAVLQSFEAFGFGRKVAYDVNREAPHLLPRLDAEKEIAVIQGFMKGEPVKKVVEIPAVKSEITIDDFAKIDLRVGKVLEATKHPNAAKLLVLKVDTGDRIRQIVSGIAEFYQPADLVGKQLIVVVNLVPVKLRGELSEGMILAGDSQGKIVIVEADKSLLPGAAVK